MFRSPYDFRLLYAANHSRPRLFPGSYFDPCAPSTRPKKIALDFCRRHQRGVATRSRESWIRLQILVGESEGVFPKAESRFDARIATRSSALDFTILKQHSSSERGFYFGKG